MKFLIAGFGSIGRRHFRNLKALGQNDLVLFRSGKSQLPDEELTGYVVEQDIAAALAHKPNAVIVANPTSLHLDVAIPAAQAGCHILLEKPLSDNMDRVEELRTTVQSSGSRVLVGFQYRFHPGLQKVREILNAGELGKPISAQSHWGEYLPDWHPWEDYRNGYSARGDLGGGVVLTLSHPFDYLRWLFGEVDFVSGTVQRSGQLDIDVEDYADGTLEFVNDLVIKVHLDYLERPASHWLEVECSTGSMRWDAITGNLNVEHSDGRPSVDYPVPNGFDRNDLFLDQTHHFVEVVKGDAQPSCTLDDGIKALQIALAVHASNDEGKKVTL
jgi:predicted dehydrogenase